VPADAARDPVTKIRKWDFSGVLNVAGRGGGQQLPSAAKARGFADAELLTKGASFFLYDTLGIIALFENFREIRGTNWEGLAMACNPQSLGLSLCLCINLQALQAIENTFA
jgi:hypothetical protein